MRPEPTTDAWTLVDTAKPDVPLSIEARAWQCGPITVLVLDFPGTWGVSVTAGPDRASDEQFATVRRDFGLDGIDESPELHGVRYLFVDEVPPAVPLVSYTGPNVYKGQEVHRLDISATGWRGESIDFGDGATVVGLTDSGDEVPIDGGVVVLADLPDGVVALQWSGGGR